MREFESPEDYRRFADSVMHRSRYLFESHVDDFLQTIAESGQKRLQTLTVGEILWRAQLGHEWDSVLVDYEDPHEAQAEIPGAYAPTRLKPLKDSAFEGRVNPKGIPCLYLADDKDTAMTETRPWLRSYVSLAQFKVIRSLKIMDCSEAKRYFPSIVGFPLDAEFEIPPMSPREKEDAVWGEIGYAFSEPVTRSDSTAEYVPTQVLAEAFRKDGCDGIRYRSLLGTGHNFALFDLNSAELVNCSLFETAKISFAFEQARNTYYVTRHYPDTPK